jgi:cell division control protein 6
MRLFRTAGELADREGSDVVGEDHVRSAQDTLEKDRFRDFLQGTPTQMKAACLSISAKSLYSSDDYVITGELYDAYQQITDAIDMDTIGIRRFRDILDEMQLSQVIETKEVNMGNIGYSTILRLSLIL